MDSNIKSKSSPLVSFLVPTYNRAGLVRQAVESILSQSYKNIEVIVIDDASTDDTENIIRENFNGKVKYYKNDVNRGVAYSRNFGLKHARGKYIGLLDSDDRFREPSSIETAINILESNPEICLFTTDCYCIDLDGNRVYESTFFETTIDHRNIELSSGIKDFEYMFCHGIHSCGAIFRKDITEEIGFLNTDYKIGWDEDFFLRIAADKRFKIYYHNSPMVDYRIHNSSFSSNHSELYRDKINVRYSILKTYPNFKAKLGKKINKRFANQYYCLIDAYVKEKKILRSFQAAISAIYYNPPIIFQLIGKIFETCVKCPKKHKFPKR